LDSLNILGTWSNNIDNSASLYTGDIPGTILLKRGITSLFSPYVFLPEEQNFIYKIAQIIYPPLVANNNQKKRLLSRKILYSLGLD
jgi:hypothetical protein